jgi:hypothetical protein
VGIFASISPERRSRCDGPDTIMIAPSGRIGSIHPVDAVTQSVAGRA